MSISTSSHLSQQLFAATPRATPPINAAFTILSSHVLGEPVSQLALTGQLSLSNSPPREHPLDVRHDEGYDAASGEGLARS